MFWFSIIMLTLLIIAGVGGFVGAGVPVGVKYRCTMRVACCAASWSSSPASRTSSRAASRAAPEEQPVRTTQTASAIRLQREKCLIRRGIAGRSIGPEGVLVFVGDFDRRLVNVDSRCRW